MLDLIGSVEFGDWLIQECEQQNLQAASHDPALSQAARQRLESLEQAKNLLYEFLRLQEDMMSTVGNGVFLQDSEDAAAERARRA